MASKSSEQSRKNAAHLRERKIVRNSGMCPWGCGRPIQNGGNELSVHLSHCRGKRPYGRGNS